MNKKPSERRLVENQVLFRQRNEKIAQDLAALKKAAAAEGHEKIAQNVEQHIDKPLHFYCECADEKCRQRIVLKPSEYQELHQNSSQFVLLPGHNLPGMERVVLSRDAFIIVEKYETPPSAPDALNATTLDNT